MAQATSFRPQDDEDIQSFVLLSGHTIPAVGLRTWRSGSKAINSVFTAIVEVSTHTSITRDLLLFLRLK